MSSLSFGQAGAIIGAALCTYNLGIASSEFSKQKSFRLFLSRHYLSASTEEDSGKKLENIKNFTRYQLSKYSEGKKEAIESPYLGEFLFRHFSKKASPPEKLLVTDLLCRVSALFACCILKPESSALYARQFHSQNLIPNKYRR